MHCKMSSTQAEESIPTSSEEQPGTAPDNTSLPSPERLRQFIRFIQCPACSHPLREPFTLPCGRAICRPCLPETHERIGVTYPGLDERRQGLRCPFSACSKEHAMADCSVDIATRSVLAVVESVLDNATSTSTFLSTYYSLSRQGKLKYDDTVDDHVSQIPTLQGNQQASDSDLLTQLRNATQEEIECRLCYTIMADPLTTPCGHTFCRPCLQWALNGARYCPACRRPQTMQPAAYPVNQVLSGLANFFWQDVIQEQRLDETAGTTSALDAESSSRRESGSERPIFVGHFIFPTTKGLLFFFEPRYLLMIRRVLEADRIFGMVGFTRNNTPNNHTGFTALGTLVRIDTFEFLDGGRILVKASGLSRFRVLDHAIRDDYLVARIQPLNDISIPDEEEQEALETIHHVPSSNLSNLTNPPPLPLLAESINRTPTATLLNHCIDFVQRIAEKEDARGKWLPPGTSGSSRATMMVRRGQLPRDAEAFPWWFASNFPVKEYLRYEMLGTNSVRERVKMCWGWIVAWESRSWWAPSCTVM